MLEEAFAKTVLGQLTEPIAVIKVEENQNLFVFYVNEALVKTGLIYKENIGKGISDVFPATLAPEILHSCRKVLELNQLHYYQTTIGTLICSPIFENGICTSLTILFNSSENTLLQVSEQRYKSLSDHNPDAVFSFNLEGAFTGANKKTRKILGYSEEQLLGLSFEQFLHPDDLASAQHNFQLAVDGAIKSSEYRILHKSGTYVNLSVTNLPIYVNGQVVGVYGIGKDITAFNRVQRELEESEQRFRSLFDHHPDAVFSFNLKGEITSFNERTSAMSGYPADELLGKSIYKFCHPDDIDIAFQNVKQVITTGEGKSYEVRILHRETGHYFVMNVTNLPMTVHGEIIGLYSIAKDVTPLREAERELKESEQRYKSLFDYNPDLVFTLDEQGRFQSSNHAALEKLGYQLDEIKGKPFEQFVHPDDLAHTKESFQAALQGEIRQYQLRAIRKNEDFYTTFRITNIPININNRIEGVFGIAKNITELVSAQQELEESEERHRKLTDISPEAIIVHRLGVIDYVNQAAVQCLRANTREDLIGKAVDSIFAEESLNTAAILEKELQQTGSANKVREFHLQRMDGSKGHAEVVGTRFYTKGQSLSLLIVRDITERKKSEQLIEFMAYHDSLTKLSNRESFQMKVKEHLKREENGAMLFIDLDRFKMINDTLGHRTGDLLLIEVSRRLKVYEEGLLSRQGGDEFTIYFPNFCKKQAKEKTEEILESLSKPYIIEGQELFITPSVGISIFPTDSRDYDMLIQQADVALYESKAVGGNTYTFYSAASKEVNEKKMTISNDLRKALLKEEFYLCYQPIFDTRTREIVGAEALLRWNHPVRGFIAPDEFIPIAEETGLIIPIGEWVIRTACQQMKLWYEEGFSFQISVNLSLRQFIQHNLVEMIEKTLKQVNLPPHLLNLEVTESVPLLDVEASIKKLNDLKTLGITISLDDFGTGYSSLNHIRLLPFDYLKIDRSFVQNIETDNVSSSIVQSVISLAHIMGKRVVAEGVETEQQLSLLHGTMCDEAQGYYLSKPVEVGLFNQLLNKIKKTK